MHSDKWGPLGSIFAALCCLGVTPVLGALSAIGLGFLIHDAILIPLLGLFLAATIWGIQRDRRRHRSAGPVTLALLAAGLTLAGLWVSPAMVAAGLVALVSSSLWNLSLVRSSSSAPGNRQPEGNR
ncbi:MAG: MerC family mercury resistance protein [Thermoanaerobaculia bacterium]